MTRLERKIIAVLGVADGYMPRLLRERYGERAPRVIYHLAQNVVASCKAGFEVFKGQFEPKEWRALDRRIKAIRYDGLPVERAECIMVSMMIGAITDLLEHGYAKGAAADPVFKRSARALEEVQSRLMSVNRYFDPKGRRHADYDAAEEALKSWNLAMEA